MEKKKKDGKFAQKVKAQVLTFGRSSKSTKVLTFWSSAQVLEGLDISVVRPCPRGSRYLSRSANSPKVSTIRSVGLAHFLHDLSSCSSKYLRSFVQAHEGLDFSVVRPSPRRSCHLCRSATSPRVRFRPFGRSASPTSFTT